MSFAWKSIRMYWFDMGGGKTLKTKKEINAYENTEITPQIPFIKDEGKIGRVR
jgi:hypothetical protein